MDGGARASAIPIYNKFVDLSKLLKPRYISLIMPARWYTGGRGLEAFRLSMLKDTKIEMLYDYIDGRSIFTNVEIKGGICYFLWNSKWKKECLITTHVLDSETPIVGIRYLKENDDNVFIRDPRMLHIKNSVSNNRKIYGEKTFDNVVSSMKPYGLRGDFFKDPTKYGLPKVSDNEIPNGICIVGLGDNQKRVKKYAPHNYPLPNIDGLDTYKIFIPRNWGTGKIQDSVYKTYLAKPFEACT